MSINKRISSDGILFEIINYTFMILLCITMVAPFLYIISISFMKDSVNITSIIPREFSLSAYKKVFESEYIAWGYLNTIIRTVSGTLLTMLFTILTAYPLSKRNFPARTFLTSVIVFTMFFSGGLIPSYLLVKELGMIDKVWALILPGLIQTFNMLLIRNHFMSIPDSLEESAKVDGANEILILFIIIIPVSISMIVTISLWTAVAHWNAWFDCLIYINEPKNYVLQIVLRRTVLEGTAQMADLTGSASENLVRNIESIKAAMIIITTVPILLVYPFIQKYFIQGIMVGSLKG